jgi:methionine-rich copper-binding protein CopC
MSSTRRRLAVLAVATTLATSAGVPQAAAAETLTAARPSAQAVVVPEPAAIEPPASVTGLARDLGVSTDFAWRTLDELARSGAAAVPPGAPGIPARPV